MTPPPQKKLTILILLLLTQVLLLISEVNIYLIWNDEIHFSCKILDQIIMLFNLVMWKLKERVDETAPPLVDKEWSPKIPCFTKTSKLLVKKKGKVYHLLSDVI